MSEVRVIVTGSRRWGDRKLIEDTLYELGIEHAGKTITIVEGEAGGADKISRQEAQKAGMLIDPHRAEWESHGLGSKDPVPCNCRPTSNHCPRAGHRRNEKMASLGADLCLAFWDGRSTGTKDMMDRAEAHGIPVRMVRIVPPLVQAS